MASLALLDFDSGAELSGTSRIVLNCSNSSLSVKILGMYGWHVNYRRVTAVWRKYLSPSKMGKLEGLTTRLGAER